MVIPRLSNGHSAVSGIVVLAVWIAQDSVGYMDRLDYVSMVAGEHGFCMAIESDQILVSDPTLLPCSSSSSVIPQIGRSGESPMFALPAA